MRDAELHLYRDRLVEMAHRLRGEVADLDRTIAGEGNDPTDISHLPTHAADQTSEGLDAEKAMERNQVGILNAVEAALGRIEKHQFGICADCGSPIPVARLDAIPYAAYCVSCERARE